MIYPSTNCRWCSVPLRWTSEYEFVNYAFEYFQREYGFPINFASRVYYKPKSRSRWNVCRACYRLNLNKIHQREITGRCNLVNHKGFDVSPYVSLFMMKLMDQSWRHRRYHEFMWHNGHTIDAFIEYLYVRDALYGSEMNYDEVEYYYEDMVRSHFQVPNHHEPILDDEDNIISFHLNGRDTIIVNAHLTVE